MKGIRVSLEKEGKQVLFWILMLLSVIVTSEKNREELLNCLWNALLGEEELVECLGYLY